MSTNLSIAKWQNRIGIFYFSPFMDVIFPWDGEVEAANAIKAISRSLPLSLMINWEAGFVRGVWQEKGSRAQLHKDFHHFTSENGQL